MHDLTTDKFILFKWDGKTIALGTFSAQEAAEKCNKAKALTKKWRTTMIPKPDVEWVKNTLERLNIRVVNDRPGRRKKRPISDLDQISRTSSPSQQQRLIHLAQSRDQTLQNNGLMFNQGGGVSNSFSTLGNSGSHSPLARRLSNPTHYNSQSQQRSLPNSVLATLPNPGNVYNIANSLSGYETTTTNDYHNALNTNERATMVQGSNTTQQQLANLAFGSNQHYEVLKEHHMNLLKELQETTALMNMYHNNTQQNTDQYSLNRNQDAFDPYLAGLNQMLPSPNPRRDSLGLGGNFHGAGISQLTNQGSQFETPYATTRDAMIQGASYPTPMSDVDIQNIGDRKRKNEGK